MGVRITSTEGKVALFDSVTETAFGPIFDETYEAEMFLDWLAERGSDDPRRLAASAIDNLHGEWLDERTDNPGGSDD